jgi:hypothetical protein
MSKLAVVLGLLAVLAAPPRSDAGTGDELRALYDRFYTAQNRRDLADLRRIFLDSSEFLWVSDGQSFWGPDAVLERMSAFQTSEV